MPISPASDHPVRDLIAQADQQRRGRLIAARLRQVAPVAAGLSAATALVARLLGWSSWLGVAVLLGATVVLAGYAWWAGRARETSDAMASRVDADAGLSGELRSAHWFEAQTAHDDWAQFHLNHAARRASAVDWASLYPSASSVKPWLATAVLSVLAVALAFRVPARAREAVPAPAVVNAQDIGDGLTPELREKLAALIAQLNAAVMDKDPAAKDAALGDLKDLMAKMDPATAQKLADMLAKQDLKASSGKKSETPEADKTADALDKAAEGLPDDAKWAQDNADAKMAQAGQAQQQQGKANAEATKPGERGQGPAQGQQSAEGTQQALAPLMRETAEQQNGKMMMGGGPMGGDPRAGSGPTQDPSKGAAQALLVAQALKKELVEASADALGENVEKEDLRRKTEQGTSSLGFTRVAAPRVEPSRATAPPPVPDARRPLLFNYFIRRR